MGLARAALILSLAWPAAAGAAELTEGQVRAFVQRQEAAWNARDLAGFFGLFTADAVFVDQTRSPKGEMIPYGRSSLAKARAQAAKFMAASTSVERGVVDRVVIAPDGRSARVTGREVSTIQAGGRTRTLCADTEQTVVLAGGRLRSRGQTDTLTRCP